MGKKILSGVRPTRIELLKLRKREILAQKGHDLLEEKRDALNMAFFRLTDDYHEEKRICERKKEEAFEKLSDARLVMGFSAIRGISGSLPEIVDIRTEVRQIMGVRIPKIHAPERLRQEGERAYSYISTTAALDNAADAFEDLLCCILALAEKESAIRILAHEIQSINRRVNALENILIPRLHNTQRYIEMHLEELEREDLFRRKRMKMLLNK